MSALTWAANELEAGNHYHETFIELNYIGEALGATRILIVGFMERIENDTMPATIQEYVVANL